MNILRPFKLSIVFVICLTMVLMGVVQAPAHIAQAGYASNAILQQDFIVIPAAPDNTPTPENRPAVVSQLHLYMPLVSKASISTQPTATDIYADQLASGWVDWSWNTIVNLANTTPVQSGNRSIAVTYQAGWGGLYLHHAPISTSGITQLRFWLHGGSAGGRQIHFVVNQNVNSAITLTLAANTWSQVDVPLASVGYPSTIVDLWWQDISGSSQPVFYLDQVSLIGSGATQPTATPAPSDHFYTLPPGSTLPGDSECASRVRSASENKGMNTTYNATVGGQGLASNFFTGDDVRANTEIGVRVTGNFTGATDEILQWAACKWGIDEDIVRAQAAKESWWQQTVKGDWTTDASRCAPGHGLGVDGIPGQCPESFGILQNRYPYEQSAWPGIYTSTAFNADTAYAIWRVCYEGYEYWLNDVERGSEYAAGDAWGCVGRWYAGRWHTDAAETYISAVQEYLNTRVWETPGFQEP